jgi:2-amino-4-hydroxy-6-hydroxymethyldihydropteridine diphosphokinase
VDCVVGLGSNLGDRRKLLAGAVVGIARLGDLRAVSSLYETEPVGPPQPAYLNAALLLRTELSPEPLLDEMLALERAAGRVRAERWGARTLDLDLLWIDGRALESDRLVVPHPELAERAFALVPLLDVAPLASDPRSGVTYRSIVARLAISGVRPIGAPEQWLDAKILQSFRD